MQQGVKTIFKVLLGTIVSIVFVCIFVEFFNIMVVGMQLRQIARLAAVNACDLFTQETYKGNDSYTSNVAKKQGTIMMPEIKDASGATYITGDFYGVGGTGPLDASTRESIWKSIYGIDGGTPTAFIDFCEGNTSTEYNSITLYDNANPSGKDLIATGVGVKGVYENIGYLYRACKYGRHTPTPITWRSSPDAVKEYMEQSKANTYYDQMYTAVNCGVPYLDNKIVNRMYRYNLAKVLMNGGTGLVQNDRMQNVQTWHSYAGSGVDANTNYINYKGFKCYVQDAKMDHYDYVIFNVKDAKSNTTINSKFNEYTNMSAAHDTNTAGTQIGLGQRASAGLDQADNDLVTVVGINFNLPCNYVGVTPIRKVFQWIINYQVGGFNGGAYPGPAVGPQIGDAQQWNENKVTMKSGGVNGDVLLPNSGRLIYTLVR